MKIAVIGYGRFGKVLVDLLKDSFSVSVYDQNQALLADLPGNCLPCSNINELKEVEALFLAVPINSLAICLKDLTELFNNSKIRMVVDVLSVKMHPKQIFSENLPAHVTALLTHPMFGPDSIRSQGLAGQVIVLDQFTLSPKDYAFWKEFFAGKGLKVIELSAEEHDQIAANSQGLTHYIGRVLAEMSLKPSTIDTLGTKKLLEIKEQTCNDTWELFTDLQNKNPYTIDMRVRLGQAVSKVYDRLLPDRINPRTLIVGIQGGKGSFNEEAARYYLKRAGVEKFDLVYLYTTPNVLEALHEGRIDRGQFAIHNSTGGMVEESVEAMASQRFRIIEQFSIKIAHAMMTRPEVALEDIDTIMTHPQVLKQCKRNLEEKYSRLKLTSGTGDLVDHSNVAAHLAAGKLPATTGTMGSKVLAEIYGLRLVEENLQDLDQNFTSFLWVGRPKSDIA